MHPCRGRLGVLYFSFAEKKKKECFVTSLAPIFSALYKMQKPCFYVPKAPVIFGRLPYAKGSSEIMRRGGEILHLGSVLAEEQALLSVGSQTCLFLG